MSALVTFITTGGTIDKFYFDAKSEFQIGDPQVPAILEEGNVTLASRTVPAMRKDSLEMSDADRQRLREIVEAEDGQRIVITHGTDTMVDTARALAGIEGKTIVFTGAMQPARMRRTDSVFNVGFALAAVQLLPTGVYIAMNGQVFDPSTARKNVAEHRFEIVDD